MASTARPTLRSLLIAFFARHPAAWHRPDSVLAGLGDAYATASTSNALRMLHTKLRELADGPEPVLLRHASRTGGAHSVWYALAAQPPPGAAPSAAAAESSRS
jgi:hypothetical protein